ncbi:EscU/YscU/HrcU family type III secretion system export apparatus switch protein [Pseudoalteromonas sp. AS84]|jgi:flagellar biosynthesis protein|uniref:Flagellar biosynthesis protein FlhB n=1 Tax=Pseudoalteromonas arctica TaxID=394751 RepID=A0A7X9YF41_9GAMM|nr:MULTISPECIES: EscU/YscU/HrcU family type III secretion system export apparatus switch protein [Pseudoalteromonas]MBH0089848.1 EscU/YscU/HrcU family type III secretion system export apparatus switch protein [Pseudoalteromonas sp. NSLLW218]NMF48553.1 flagellar biosynthesis protein FlhB [Pseudoalteromonas arctica]|tara:strand:+ start:3410 stop:3718 length:309 start_codon:yes stop_codon:yes gene_type:complete
MSDTPINKSAIGLLYEAGNTPTVSVKGFGELADEIIAAAKLKGIMIHEDAELAKTLSHLSLGEEIPKELYYVIAELIAFSYVLRGQFPPGWQDFQGKLNIKA